MELNLLHLCGNWMVVWQITSSLKVPSLTVRWTTLSLIRRWFPGCRCRWWPCPPTPRQTPHCLWPHWCGRCLCDGTCSGSGIPEYIGWWRSPLQWYLQRTQTSCGHFSPKMAKYHLVPASHMREYAAFLLLAFIFINFAFNMQFCLPSGRKENEGLHEVRGKGCMIWIWPILIRSPIISCFFPVVYPNLKARKDKMWFHWNCKKRPHRCHVWLSSLHCMALQRAVMLLFFFVFTDRLQTNQ